MNILIPMAGAGRRFFKSGYKKNKAVIPTIDRRTGIEKPMVICAVSDLPSVHSETTKIIFVDRDFHKSAGVEEEIYKYFQNSLFITVDHLTEGQACTCLLAKDLINNDDELLISACDNGIVFDENKYDTLKQEADVIAFTFTHNESSVNNPNAYGWVIVDNDNDMNCKGCSVKKAISENPENDHAIIATFWYRHGSDFVRAAEQMIEANDRINKEFYIDTVLNYNVSNGCRVKAFDVDKYIGWGTPNDYENYQNTIKYWTDFLSYIEK